MIFTCLRFLVELNDHFGTAQDLKDLSSALHSRNMYLMVDVIANHVGVSCPSCTSSSPPPESATGPYSIAKPISFTPSSLYGAYNKSSHYHPASYITDWSDQSQLEDRWLGPFDGIELPDLDTRNPEVKAAMYSWVKNLVEEYEIDGLRLDTVKHGK